MIVKSYFLTEQERETYEQKLLTLSDIKHDELLQLDDHELLSLYETKFAQKV